MLSGHCPECLSPFVIADPELTRDCANCGECVTVRCRDCSNDFTTDDLDAANRCEECAEVAVRVARREKRIADYEAHGDYLRDMRKDDAW